MSKSSTWHWPSETASDGLMTSHAPQPEHVELHDAAHGRGALREGALAVLLAVRQRRVDLGDERGG